MSRSVSDETRHLCDHCLCTNIPIHATATLNNNSTLTTNTNGLGINLSSLSNIIMSLYVNKYVFKQSCVSPLTAINTLHNRSPASVTSNCGREIAGMQFIIFSRLGPSSFFFLSFRFPVSRTLPAHLIRFDPDVSPFSHFYPQFSLCVSLSIELVRYEDCQSARDFPQHNDCSAFCWARTPRSAVNIPYISPNTLQYKTVYLQHTALASNINLMCDFVFSWRGLLG